MWSLALPFDWYENQFYKSPVSPIWKVPKQVFENYDFHSQVYTDILPTPPHPPSPISSWSQLGGWGGRRMKKLAREKEKRKKKSLFLGFWQLSSSWSLSFLSYRRHSSSLKINSSVFCWSWLEWGSDICNKRSLNNTERPYYSPFFSEETEGQWSSVTCPRSKGSPPRFICLWSPSAFRGADEDRMCQSRWQQ